MFMAGAANRSAAAVREAFPAVSMRFQQALTEQEIKRLAEYLPENSLGITQIAYWTEQENSIRNERNHHETEAQVILFAGNGNLVWPHSFLTGGYPGVGDASGCTISAGLADKIFGATDVVGQPVLISETEYQIRGVWDSPELRAMLQLKTNEPVFKNLEALMKTERDYREAAMDLARENQLSCSAIINGPIAGMLSGFVGSLPFYLAGLALFIKMIWNALMPCAGFRSRLTAALLAAAVVLLMCGLRAGVPDYLVPTKWSDFDYWGRLAADYRDQLIELISLTPTSKDIFFRLEILRLGGYLLGGMVSATAYLSYALKQWPSPASRIAIPMHVIWIGAAWACITLFPVDVRLMYLLCCPFLALALLQSVKANEKIRVKTDGCAV